jgi:hypothetical protein
MRIWEKIYKLKLVPSFLLWSSFLFIIFYSFCMFGVNMEKNASLSVSIFISLFGGVLFETGKYGMKKSIMFWDMAKIVETKLHDAKSTDELNGLINEYFVKGGKLRELSMGGPHIVEMNRLYTIYQTYYKVQNKK